VVRLYYVEIPDSVLGEAASDHRRLLEALDDQWDLTGVDLDPRALADLQSSLVDGKGAVTVAIHDRSEITAVWPGFKDRCLGVAFDVGSTTIAGHLCDLLTGEVLASHGQMNPQIRFGEDVMSRVSYVMMNQGGAHWSKRPGVSARTSWKLCWWATRSCTISSSASTRLPWEPHPSSWPPIERSASTCPSWE
jgi:uncharacterized 2Fe-2S/4Fe-4S cluster protein (DUF4445 family)